MSPKVSGASSAPAYAESMQQQTDAPARGNFPSPTGARQVEFRPRSVQELLNYGATDSPHYGRLRLFNCVTGQPLVRELLRPLNDAPAKPGTRGIKLLADRTPVELQNHLAAMGRHMGNHIVRHIWEAEGQLRGKNALQLERCITQLEENWTNYRKSVTPETLFSKDRANAQIFRNMKRHYQLALGMKAAEAMAGKIAGARNDSDKRRRVALEQQWKAMREVQRKQKPVDEWFFGHPEQFAQSQSVKPASLFENGARRGESRVSDLIARYFTDLTQAEQDLPLEYLERNIELRSMQDIEALLQRMRDAHRRFHVIGIAGRDNGCHDRMLVVSENVSAPWRWCIYTKGGVIDGTYSDPVTSEPIGPLMHLLTNNLEGKEKDEITVSVLSADESVLRNKLEGFRHLGYEVDHLTARGGIVEALEGVGCIVAELEINQTNYFKLRRGNQSGAVILNITGATEEHHCTMLWSEADPTKGRDLKTGRIFTGSPNSFWEKEILGKEIPVTAMTQYVVEPSDRANEIALFTQEKKETVQSDLAAAARKQGCGNGFVISVFEEISHYFVSNHPDAVSATYALGSMDEQKNAHFGTLLNQSRHHLLIEYDDDDDGSDSGECSWKRVVFNTPGLNSEGGGDATGRFYEDQRMKIYLARPSNLLNWLREKNGEDSKVRILSSGPLNTADLRSEDFYAELSETLRCEDFGAGLSESLAFLKWAGVPINPESEEQKQMFANFLLQNYGGIPMHITTNEILAKYVEHLNDAGKTGQRIEITRYLSSAGPLKLGADPRDYILQYIDEDGPVSVTFSRGADQYMYFYVNLDPESAMPIHQLEEVIEVQCWREVAPIDVLRLHKPLAPDASHSQGREAAGASRPAGPSAAQRQVMRIDAS